MVFSINKTKSIEWENCHCVLLDLILFFLNSKGFYGNSPDIYEEHIHTNRSTVANALTIAQIKYQLIEQ